MKKNILLLLLLTLSLGVFASKDTEARAKTLSNNLEKSLALTPEQKSNMYKVLLAKMDAIEALQKQPASDDQKKAIMIERRKFITDMKVALTDTQYKRWQELRSEQVLLMKKGEKVEDAVLDKELEMTLNN